MVNYSNLLILALLLGAQATTACPKRPPGGVLGQPVGEQMVVNGITMSVSQVESKGSTDELLEQAAKAWKEAGYEVKRNDAAGWDVVAAISKECLATLQFSKASGSVGYFSLGYPKKPAVTSPRALGLPLPADVKVTSNVQSVDGGRKGLTMSMTSTRPLHELTVYFAEELVKQGWSGVRPFGVVDVKTKKVSQRISAQKGRQQVQIMMWSELNTQIVMTIAEGL